MTRCTSRWAWLWLGLLASLTSSCERKFTAQSEVTGFRLITVTADPSIVALGGSTVLRAITYNPSGDAVSYGWSFCPFRGGSTNDYRCQVDEGQFLDDIGDPPQTAASFGLGSGDLTLLRNNLDPSLLLRACAGANRMIASDAGAAADAAVQDAGPAPAYTANCNNFGFPATVELDVHHGDTTARAIKQVYLALYSGAPSNANPGITQLLLRGPSGTTATVAQRGTKYTLEVDLAADAAETYPVGEGLPSRTGATPSATGGPGAAFGGGVRGRARTTRESLSISWFADRGLLESSETSGLPPAMSDQDAGEDDGGTPAINSAGVGTCPRPDAGTPDASVMDASTKDAGSAVCMDFRTNSWTVGWDTPVGSAAIYVVVRDDRGGVSWLHKQVTVR